MVDAVITVVVAFHRLIDGVPVNVHERTFVLYGLLSQTVGKVNHLTHLTVLEKCGIAFAINLLNLPTDRREHEHIFTRHGVGLHFHALALYSDCGLVPTACRMNECGVADCVFRIQVVVHKP